MRIFDKITVVVVLFGLVLFAAISMGGEERASQIRPLPDRKPDRKIGFIGLVDDYKGSANDKIKINRLQQKIHELDTLINKQKIGSKRFSENDFENSICFRRCHKKNEFSPSEKSRRQWFLLIGKNGHAIFDKIPWESPIQKQRVLNFLLKHAGSSGKEGIGVWE